MSYEREPDEPAVARRESALKPEIRDAELEDQLRSRARRRRMEERQDAVAERRWRLALYLIAISLVLALGALGLGLVLIIEGLDRSSTTFAALGVVLVVVAVLSTSTGAWHLSGPIGLELRRDAPAPVEEQSAPRVRLDHGAARSAGDPEEAARPKAPDP